MTTVYVFCSEPVRQLLGHQVCVSTGVYGILIGNRVGVGLTQITINSLLYPQLREQGNGVVLGIPRKLSLGHYTICTECNGMVPAWV